MVTINNIDEVIARINARINNEQEAIMSLKTNPITPVTRTKIGPSMVKVKKGYTSYILKDGKMIASCGLKGKWEDASIERNYVYEPNMDKVHNNLLKAWENVSGEDIDRPNVQDGVYDGTVYECIHDKDATPREEKKSILGTLKWLDTNERKKVTTRKINVGKLIEYLCSINEIRELVHNNTWGIVVKTPKSTNYPEKVVMSSLKDIIMEALSNDSDREKHMIWLDAAPEGSIAAKIWNMIPKAEEHDIEMGDVVPEFSGTWENVVKKLTMKGGNKLTSGEYDEIFEDTYHQIFAESNYGGEYINRFDV